MHPQNQNQDQIFTADQAAALLKVSRPTFDRGVRCGAIPKGIRLTGPTGHPRWTQAQLAAVLTQAA